MEPVITSTTQEESQILSRVHTDIIQYAVWVTPVNTLINPNQLP